MNRRERSFSFTKSVEDDELGTLEIAASGTISAFAAATMYDSHGDPGSPAEGGEVEFAEVSVVDSEGRELSDYEPDSEVMEEAAYENAY
jgi:hypothetical protein